ncbi:MAG: hypothetical protein JST11_13490 [Acidobacteria bacterium]|nr:hypothetical protein [Acidobacteriota bacterium]
MDAGKAAAKEPAKPPEAVTAQTAYYEMYKAGRAWATDLLALSVVSGEVPNIENEGGKAGLWTVTFVSPGRKEARIFTYAVANGEAGVLKGINVGGAVPWAGATPTSKTFANSEFLVDSDAAYKAAAEKAAGWLKTHPNMKATFHLGNASRYPAPVWYVMWGTTKNGYAALVNAVTGTVIK